MKLYHGSNVEIITPDLSKSKPYKDFGQGFYLSSLHAQALAMARQKTDQYQSGTPCVTLFEWDKEGALADLALKVKFFDDYSREWAEFILANRDRKLVHPIHDYDIVVGSIADDGVTFQLRRYRTGGITMERLIDELKYTKGLTIQYFFGTPRALAYLKRL